MGVNMKREYKLFERSDVRQKIQESLKKSRYTNKEHGFNFYISEGKLIVSDVVEGGKASLDIKDKYKKGAKLVGSFHAHTRLINKDVVPSPTDINKAMTEDFNFFCVGASLDDHDIIRCFTKGDLEEEMREILQALDTEKNKDNIDKSSRLIAGKMAADKDYLEGHSSKNVYKKYETY